jgi:hypothetical protein
VRRSLPSFLAVLLLAAAALPAPAAEALFLTWDDCAEEGAGGSDNPIGCFVNEGDQVLFCSFTLDSAVDQVLGIEAVVDLQHSGGELPDWWELSGTGACREGALRVSGDFSLIGACTDPWRGLGGGVAFYQPGLPRQQPNQARLLGTFAVVPSDSARSLEPGVAYYGLQLLISNDKSVSLGSCAGCTFPACLVLNSITLLRAPGAPGGNVTLTTPGAGNGNWVTWKGGAGANCGLVPVRRTSWGRIRTLYR